MYIAGCIKSERQAANPEESAPKKLSPPQPLTEPEALDIMSRQIENIGKLWPTHNKKRTDQQ